MIDWQTVIIAGIAAVPPTLMATAALWQAIKTHKSVNSRMDELLKAATDAATAEATIAEKAAAQGRRGQRSKARKGKR